MPQLDRLLSVMVSNRAESLRLVENELASLVKDGAAVPLTKQALGATQLLGLLERSRHRTPCVVSTKARRPSSSTRVGDSVFNARATNEGGKWIAAITAGTNGGTATPLPSGVGRPTPTSAPSRVAPPPVASSNGVYVGEDTTARSAMDNLLRQLVEQSGSDLHLRCGEPPILRRQARWFASTTSRRSMIRR